MRKDVLTGVPWFAELKGDLMAEDNHITLSVPIGGRINPEVACF